jgi:uncharacterized membrane protein
MNGFRALVYAVFFCGIALIAILLDRFEIKGTTGIAIALAGVAVLWVVMRVLLRNTRGPDT